MVIAAAARPEARTRATTPDCSALPLTRLLTPSHPQSQPEDGPPQRECENCSGTGFVECWCNRWSDNDGGCSTCRGSGRMVCSSCRGGGTAVPIQARIYIDNERTSTFKQNR